jgi:hypothetical protein
MRSSFILLLLATVCATAAAVEEVRFQAYSVVFYHEYVLVDGTPVETSKSLVLSQLTQSTIGDDLFLTGVVPEGIGSDFAGTTIRIRSSLVYMIMGTDSDRAAKVLTTAASKGVWREVVD